MSGVITTPRFRVSFPYVFEKSSLSNKYEVVACFNMEEINADPEEKKKWDRMVEAMNVAIVNRWGDKVPSTLKKPFRKGEEKGEEEPYGEGVVFIVPRSKDQPRVVSMDPSVLLNDSSQFYPGCYARAAVNAYAWDGAFGKGVSFGLNMLQKVADGTPLTGRSAMKAEDVFEAVTPANDLLGENTSVEEDLFG